MGLVATVFYSTGSNLYLLPCFLLFTLLRHITPLWWQKWPPATPGYLLVMLAAHPEGSLSTPLMAGSQSFWADSLALPGSWARTWTGLTRGGSSRKDQGIWVLLTPSGKDPRKVNTVLLAAAQFMKYFGYTFFIKERVKSIKYYEKKRPSSPLSKENGKGRNET